MHLAYGPQLGHRLQLSHAKQNLVGLSGNCTAGRLSIQCNRLIETPPQLVYMGRHHLSGNSPTREDRGSLWLSLSCYF